MTTQMTIETERKKDCSCKPARGVFTLLTFLIATGALSLASFSYYKGERQVQQQSADITKNLEKNQSDTKSLLLSVSDLKIQQQQQHELLQNLTTGLERLAATKPLKSQEWVVREVDYLVKTATANLQFSRDIDGTVALLTIADQRLQGLVDPDAAVLRQSLTDNITSLKNVPRFDRGGLMARIQSLSNQTTTLPLRSPLNEGKPTNKVEATSAPIWRNALHNSLQALQKLVVVRHLDQNISPMLAPQDQVLLVRNIQFIFEQAQWAAIRSDEKLFKQSLAQVRQIIAQYYVSEAQPTQAALKEVDELATLNVAPALPDFSATQQKIAEILAKEATTQVSH